MPSLENHPAVTGKGAAYWRSLEHLADSPQMRELIGKEFPGYDADEMINGSRRHFLKIMGASMALAGVTLSGCRRWPEEKLAPYSTNERDRMPGVPEQYATAFELGGVAQPLLVTSYDGRPIKVEGNPSHPFSWTVKNKVGATSAYAQATVLEMYDPQRSRVLVDNRGHGPKESSWPEFQSFAAAHFAKMNGDGTGFAILSEASDSPSVADMKARLLKTFPNARWFEYEPVNRDTEIEGAKLAFGKPVRIRLNLDKASRVVLFDADLLGRHPAQVRYAADWIERRRAVDPDGDGKMSRVYIAEAGFSLTGTIADVRLGVDPSRLYPLMREVALKLGVSGVSGGENLSAAEARFVDAVVADLNEAGGSAVVAAGPVVPVAGHALAHAINQKIGAVGNTVTLLEDPGADRASHLQAISTLVTEMAAGQIKTLLILGGNPVFDAPADLKFQNALGGVPMTIRLGLYEDETSHSCKWHLPRAHYLESWGDARAWDGTAGIIQPLIHALYDGKSTIETLALVIDAATPKENPATAPSTAPAEAAPATAPATTRPAATPDPNDGYQIVRRTWRQLIGEGDFDHEFRKALEAGLLPGSQFPVAQVSLKVAEFPPAPAQNAQGYYLRFEPDSHAYDGRFANNGWLQETPDPLTKLVWDNAAMLSKKDADKLGVKTGDMIRIDTPIEFGHQSVQLAAYVLPGQPSGVVTLPLGYGRTFAGDIGDNLGFNTYALRSTKGFHIAPGAYLQLASGLSYRLVATQDHHILDAIGAAGRERRVGGKDESGTIIHEVDLAEYRKDPASALGGPRKVSLQLFQPPLVFNDSHAWGMAVDMNACIGCNACALACQAENNIPIVGKIEADNHRAMNWIRIDRYFKGGVDDANIEVVYQPMMCQHCENAPCEQVCPVGATVHDSEGLNTMVYNRCIGTRYCSNNCPYKVRRFNYFDYHSKDPRSNWGTPYGNIPDLQQRETVNKIKQMMFNPEVTVRMRGVMEKCTYCVQRIHGATIARRASGQDVKDGDIITACQQACPTQAIVFGNLNDPNSRVVQLHKSPRSYGVLAEELNTRPRTKYLAKVRNRFEAGADDQKA